jgi:hypothetical protein
LSQFGFTKIEIAASTEWRVMAAAEGALYLVNIHAAVDYVRGCLTARTIASAGRPRHAGLQIRISIGVGL